MTTRTCPSCGRNLETVKRGPFRVECWPTHDAKPLTTSRLTPDEWNQYHADHRMSNRSNQTDRCPESGQPV